MYAEEEELAFRGQNDESLASLRQKVQRMKSLSTDIHHTIEVSTHSIDALHADMDRGSLSLGDVMDRLRHLRANAHTLSHRLVCSIVLFVIFLFLFFYYGVQRLL